MQDKHNFDSNTRLSLETSHRESLRDLAIEFLRKPLPDNYVTWKAVGSEFLKNNPEHAIHLRAGVQRALADPSYLDCWKEALDEFEDLYPPYENISEPRIRGILENGISEVNLGDLALFAVSSDQMEVTQDAIIEEMPQLWAEFVDAAMDQAAREFGYQRRPTAEVANEIRITIANEKSAGSEHPHNTLSSDSAIKLSQNKKHWITRPWAIFTGVACLLLPIAWMGLQNWTNNKQVPIDPNPSAVPTITKKTLPDTRILAAAPTAQSPDTKTLGGGTVTGTVPGRRHAVVIPESEYPQLVFQIERTSIVRVATIPPQGGDVQITANDGQGKYVYFVVISAPEVKNKDTVTDWFGTPSEQSKLMHKLQEVGPKEEPRNFDLALEAIDNAIKKTTELPFARSVNRLTYQSKE